MQYFGRFYGGLTGMERLNNKFGFTLLELMISMSILATALMGILPFFFYSQAQIKQATITNIAMGLIQEKMERIAQLDYDSIHFMDAPFYPDLTTQYLYILPEVNMSPCTDVAPNPCGFKSWCNCLVDIVEKQGYFFTRTIDIDDVKDFPSMETASTRRQTQRACGQTQQPMQERRPNVSLLPQMKLTGHLRLVRRTEFFEKVG